MRLCIHDMTNDKRFGLLVKPLDWISVQSGGSGFKPESAQQNKLPSPGVSRREDVFQWLRTGTVGPLDQTFCYYEHCIRVVQGALHDRYSLSSAILRTRTKVVV